LFAPSLHAGGDLAHRQNLDIAAIARANQSFQNVIEEGETLSGFRQIFGMQAEMEDAPQARGSFQSAREAFDAGPESDHPRA
jgi:hypothetical protein